MFIFMLNKRKCKKADGANYQRSPRLPCCHGRGTPLPPLTKIATKPQNPGSTPESCLYPPSPGDVYPPSPGDVHPPSPGGVYPPSPGGVYSPSPGDVYSPSPGDVYSPSPGDVYPPSPGGVYPPSPGGVYPPSPGGVVWFPSPHSQIHTYRSGEFK